MDAGDAVGSAESAALSARQAAEVCGVSERTIRNWIASGRLPAVRIGSRFHIAREDVAPLVRARPLPAPAAEEARTPADLPPSDSTRSAESSGADYSVPAIVEALRLVRYQQDQIAQLAGQVGFLQAQLESTREQLRLQAPPPAASSETQQESQAGQRDAEPEREAAMQERRSWWKFW